MPAFVGAYVPEVALPEASRPIVEVNTGAVAHVASLGPYRLKVTVDPASALTRLVTVAWSLISPPMSSVPPAVVAMFGVTGGDEEESVTTTASFGPLQPSVTALLFASPLYAAVQR